MKFLKVFHSNKSSDFIYATEIKKKGVSVICYGITRSDKQKEDKKWQWRDVTDWYAESPIGSDKVLKIDLL